MCTHSGKPLTYVSFLKKKKKKKKKKLPVLQKKIKNHYMGIFLYEKCN